MNPKVIGAIFRRNFTSYFSNPTGYVFICVFVLLSSFAAFWPAEFFSANLANLAQLNKYLPYVMLIFIPAITMTIWADERRQGTDELLLTIPAADFDVVLGKYLAIVAIFSSALVFSMISNLLVFNTLGTPDLGLFLATYLGYWVVGLAMLAIGMVASFLTSNLTVAFILGAAFNAPLAFANAADLLFADSSRAAAFSRWSITEQFRDFGRGVISLDAIVYFLMIVVLALYLCIVLVGRRHWLGGRDGRSMAGHYLVRVISLAAITVGASLAFANTSWRYDMTTEKLSSLSPQTYEILRDLKIDRPVRIEAYVSPTVPEAYVQQRLNLLSTLRELDTMGSGRIDVSVYSVEPLSDAADRAELQFGIKPRRVGSVTRGEHRDEEIFLGVVVMSGLEKVVIPFFERELPVEYELVRSIATVTSDKRLRIGVVRTDANLLPDAAIGLLPEPIIDELRQQYEVVSVDPTAPIVERYDALLLVQPSSLSQQSLENIVVAIEKGQPVAIFEDPFPTGFNVLGTDVPRQPNPANPFAMPEPKANLERLWGAIGARLLTQTRAAPSMFQGFGSANDQSAPVIWQDFNPHPQLSHLPNLYVFLSAQMPGGTNAFNAESKITSGFQELLFPVPGAVVRTNPNLRFTPLAQTAAVLSGTLDIDALQMRMRQIGRALTNEELRLIEQPSDISYVLAAHIRGSAEKQGVEKWGSKDVEPPAGESTADSTTDTATDSTSQSDAPVVNDKINVVLVSDIDLMSRMFFDLRAQGSDSIEINLDNVTFVLNILDSLAGDDRLIELRKRRPRHRTLDAVVKASEGARENFNKATSGLTKEFEEAVTEAQNQQREALERETKHLQKLQESGQNRPEEVRAAQARLNFVTENQQRALARKLEELENNRDAAIRRESAALARREREIQDSYKLKAVLIPPIIPMLVGFLVFFNRRAREREGVSKNRLK